MIELENGARFLKQWQQDKKVIIDNFLPGTRVEFSAKYDCKDSSLPVAAYVDGDHVVADIPNILLQVAGYIRVAVLPSADDAENGPEIKDIRVVQAEKPNDYIYRETKTISYQALEQRVEELEQNGGKGTVKSVNGAEPDEDGNVEIDIPKAPVTSVNGQTGDVKIDIPQLPGDAEVLTALIETDMLPAVHDASGAILTDNSGNIILRY